MQCFKTGDKVIYIGDFYPEYTGQEVTMEFFNLEGRAAGARASDGRFLPVLWDEIKIKTIE